MILPKYASKMSDWRSLEKLKAMILSEHACEMRHNPALDVFWKLRAIILPNYVTIVSDCRTLGKLKAMIL